MVIYDRWGGIVKKIPDLRIGWDGTGPSNELMQEGVYFYVANLYSTLNGTTRIYSGHVFLFNSE
jgi:gliding motility-associated-like protein